jgi:outer membrane protein TolC
MTHPQALFTALVLSLSTWCSGALAQHSLTEVMRSAAAGLRPQSAAEQAQASKAQRLSAQRQAWLPSLSVEANAARVRNLAQIQTPNGAFTLGENNLYDVTLSVRQPLLNWSAQKYGVQALRETEEAAQLNAQRQARVAAAQAAYAYMDWLSLQAQHLALGREQRSLQQQLQRIRALVDGGRALDADALDLEVALRQLDQRRITLETQMQVLAQSLFRLSGQTVRPQPAGIRLAPVSLDNAHDLDRALDQRRDLKALRAQRQALAAEVGRVRAQALPTLGAEVSVLRTEGNPILPEDDVRAGLNLRWEPFSSGRRRADRQAAQAQLQSIELDLQLFERAIEEELTAARAQIRQARASARTAAAAKVAASDSLQTRRARLEAGRSTLDRVLAAEARLTEQDALAQSAQYAEIKASIAYRLALGAELLPLAAQAQQE